MGTVASSAHAPSFDEADHALALRGTAAVGRLALDHSRHVPAVHGSLLAPRQVADLPSVQREGADGHEGLVAPGSGVLDLR